MKPDFWHDRWNRNEISWHQAARHPGLVRHWRDLGLPAGSEVLVPLCGKSLDMHFLAEAGHRVLGVEISEVACRQFFDEAGLSASVTSDGRYRIFASGPYRLLCGDFFALTATDLTRVRGVYDRAALVALPPEMRRSYAHVIRERLPAAARILLVTFDYDPSKMPGPPHAVSLEEVRALYGDAFDVDVRFDSGRAAPPPPLAERGLDWITELTIALRRQGA
jgi:thiopurine S-methyltransferase